LHRWAAEALSGAPSQTDLVIDGIRNAEEVVYLRERFTKSFLIAVVADRLMRWERTKPEYGHDEGVFDRADKRDSEDKDDLPNGQQVERCVSASDFVLINNDKLEPSERRDRILWEALSEPIELMRGTKRQNPKEHEAYMAQAYALSHRCASIVAAVVVGPRRVERAAAAPAVGWEGRHGRHHLRHVGMLVPLTRVG